MKGTSPTFVIVHGLNGSPAGHWQRWLEGELLSLGFRVRFPDLPSREAPDLGDWIAPLHATLVDAGPDAVVIAHSLGALLWMQYASAPACASVNRVLLVAPPGMSELDELAKVTGHRSVSLLGERLRIPAKTILMAGSLQDPYCRRGFFEEYARPLSISPIYLPDRFRHVNIESGHGPWPFALRWSLVGTPFGTTTVEDNSDRHYRLAEYPEYRPGRL
jgi:uncharacterized protein